MSHHLHYFNGTYRNKDEHINQCICHPDHCFPITGYMLSYGPVSQQGHYVSTEGNFLLNNTNGSRPQLIYI